MGGARSAYRGEENRIQGFGGGKPEGKRRKRRWEDNIKMDVQELGRGYGDWMEVARDRDRWRGFLSTLMNFGVP